MIATALHTQSSPAHEQARDEARIGRSPAPARGEGRLEVALVDGCSAVVRSAASSPLQLLAPRARGSAVWLVAATHGGGLVSGDTVAIDLSLGGGATACLGTQAEAKIYRDGGGGGGARQRLSATVGPGGLLALLPDPVSPFAGSRYEQSQQFELAVGASLVVLDAVTSGRAARGERWAFAGYRSRNEVRIGGELVLADAVRLEAGEGRAVSDRLSGLELLATVILLGPRVAPAARAVLEALAGACASRAAPVLAAASLVRDGVLLRVAARSVEAGLAAVRSHLAFLAGPLDGDPLLRRP